MVLGNILLLAISIWYVEDMPAASRAVSLDVDGSGMAAVVFWENQDIYYCYRYASGPGYSWTWEFIGSAYDENFKYHDNFCIDKQGVPHVLFFRPELYCTPERYVLYATRTGVQQWSLACVGNLFMYGKLIDIAVDTVDYPHAICGCVHTYFDGVAWQTDSIRDIIEDAQPAIAVDRMNTVHLALGGPFYQTTGFIGYCRRDSTGWHVEYDSQYCVNTPVQLGVDTVGRPHVLFRTSPDSAVFYGMKENSVWTYEDITSLRVTAMNVSNGSIHLLGTDPGASTVRYYWKSGANWVFEDIHSGVPVDLAVDQDNYAHCIFYENNQLHYATNRPQTAVYEQEHGNMQHAGMCRISRLPVRIHFLDSRPPDRITIVSSTGCTIASFEPGDHVLSFEWNGFDQIGQRVPSGVYYVIQVQGKHHQVTKLIIVD